MFKTVTKKPPQKNPWDSRLVSPTPEHFSPSVLAPSNWLVAPLPPKKFALVTTSTAVALLGMIAAINWIVNPYGQYSPHIFRPVVQDSRSEKYQLFDQLPTAPEGLILGSSRAMKFEPSYLEKRTQLSFFNFAVNHGRPEDFLAILRMYRDRYGCSPKAVLIGVDIASLNDVVPSDARLSSEPMLHSYVRGLLPWHDEFDRMSQLLSYQQLSASMKSLRAATRRSIRKEADSHFDDSGVIQYVTRQRQIDEGTYDFESALQFNQREFLEVFAPFKSLSETRLAFLRETVRLCEANHCQVYLFATVHHPKLREKLIAKTDFLRVESQAIDSLRKIAMDLNANFIDFGSVEDFNGEPEEFFDGIHPKESNARRMIDRMLPKLNEALYAIQ
jgi:hypothetical protein